MYNSTIEDGTAPARKYRMDYTTGVTSNSAQSTPTRTGRASFCSPVGS